MPRRFKLTPLSNSDKYWLQGYQVNLFFGDVASARYCYAVLLLKRLNNSEEYNELVELSPEQNLELQRELFDSLNETMVWEIHGRN